MFTIYPKICIMYSYSSKQARNLKLKRILKSIISTVIMLSIIALIVLNWDKCLVQINKLKGIYYVTKGDRAMKDNNLIEAIEYYEKGLRLYPGYTSAWCNLGNILVLYEDYDSAVEKYKTGLKDTDRYIACRMNLGIVLSEKLLEYDDAIYQYEKITNAQPPLLTIPFLTDNKKNVEENIGLAYYNLGVTYHYKSLLAYDNKPLWETYNEKSVQMYESAKNILKDNYDVAYNYGLSNQIMGNYEKAKEGYCRAIKITPMNYEAHYNLAILLAHERNYRAALNEIEKAELLAEEIGNILISKYIAQIHVELLKKIMQTEGGKDYLIERENKKREIAEHDSEIYYKNGILRVADRYGATTNKSFQTCDVDDII